MVHARRAGGGQRSLLGRIVRVAAAAGCSMHEIGAVTGHRSLVMVQLDTESASQPRLAGAAIRHLENASGKQRKSGGQSIDK
jgi:hypothetical protein